MRAEVARVRAEVAEVRGRLPGMGEEKENGGRKRSKETEKKNDKSTNSRAKRVISFQIDNQPIN